MQSRPTKITFKFKREQYEVNAEDIKIRDQNDGITSTSPGFKDGKIGEQNDINGFSFHCNPDRKTGELNDFSGSTSHSRQHIKTRDQNDGITSTSPGLTDGKIGDQNDINGFPFPGNLDGKPGELNDFGGATSHGQQESILWKPTGSFSSSEEKDYSLEDEDDQYCVNAQNQLVVYDPAAVNSGEIEAVSDPVDYKTLPFPRCSFDNQSSRVLPSIGAFTVQCAICFKWRLIPTKEKYEEIREHILEQPFVCEVAREWRPEISCDDEPDIMQDDSRLWAIDKPNIAQPPPGWQRLLRIRGEGGTKFADVYYAAPSGKRLRSMVEIQRYLLEHPQDSVGVTMSQFSFQIPRPLQENYVRKRPARTASLDESGMRMLGDLEPPEVNPLAWAGPDKNTDLQLGPAYSAPRYEAPIFEPLHWPAKRSRTPTKQPRNYYQL